MIPTSQLLAAIAAQPAEPGAHSSIPRIENAKTARASVYLLDAVSKWTPANAVEFQASLAAISAPHIDLFINSPGGSVFEGVAIYNFLKNHPAKVTVHVIGLAASISSVIAMAGDEINMADGALMMVHSPSVATAGNSGQLRKDAALLDQIEEAILDIYVAKTKRPRAEIKALVQAETWFSADDAVREKFATRKTAAVKAAAQWNAADFPELPAQARAFASRENVTGPTNFILPTAAAVAAEIVKLQAEAPKPLFGIARATAAHQAGAAAKRAAQPRPSGKVDFSGLTGLARATAAARWESEQKKLSKSNV